MSSKQSQSTKTGDNMTEENKPKPIDLVRAANEAAQRLEAANARTAELMEEQAALNLATTLDGKADAGAGAPKEESDEDYAKKVMANDVETKDQ